MVRRSGYSKMVNTAGSFGRVGNWQDRTPLQDDQRLRAIKNAMVRKSDLAKKMRELASANSD